VSDARYRGGAALALDTSVSTDGLLGVADMVVVQPGVTARRTTARVTFTLWTPEIHDTPDNVRVTAYDAAGRRIVDRYVYLGTGTTRHQVVAPARSSGIHRLRLEVLVGGDTVYLDDLATW
jgi:hypothetical protein